MAHLNQAQFQREKEQRDAYEKLKKFITSKDKDQKINEHFFASLYLESMEKTIERQNKKIAEFESFFYTLSKLTPKPSSIHDLIG